MFASFFKMPSTQPNTSPVERGYNYLQMLAVKRRSDSSDENFKTLFLLAALKLPVQNLCINKKSNLLRDNYDLQQFAFFFKERCCLLRFNDIRFFLFCFCFCFFLHLTLIWFCWYVNY